MNIKNMRINGSDNFFPFLSMNHSSAKGVSMCDGWMNDVINVETFARTIEGKVIGEKEVLAIGGGK